MNLSADYDKILQETVLQDLEWHEKELDELYGDRNTDLSIKEIKIANQIVNRLTTSFNIRENENLISHLAEAIERIKEKFPEFIYPSLF